MKESHDSPAVGHVGLFKYYYNARRPFFWKGNVKIYPTICGRMRQMPEEKKWKCFNPRVTPPPTHSKPEMGRDINVLHRWVTSVERKGQNICSGRLINRICTVHGNKKTCTAKQIADIFCKNIYKLNGFQKVIVRDRDAKFNGKFWREFFKVHHSI